MDKDAAKTNEQGGTVEEKVDTVDYRKSAGEDEATKEPVQIVHSTTEENPTPGEKVGGVLTGAAVKVTNTVQSAKDAISSGGGTGSDESKKEGDGVAAAAKVPDTVQPAKDTISGTGGTDGNENKKEGGGVAAKVSETVQSAKEAVTGAVGSHDDKKETTEK